jgi:hypothetical protein
MKNVFSLIINLAMAYCVWIALHGNVGAGRVTVFLAILTAVCFVPACCVASSDENKPSPTYEYLNRIIDIFMLGA